MDNRTKDATINLEPYRTVNIDVKKWLLKKGLDWNLDKTETQSQAPDEDTLIILERKSGPDDVDFMMFAEVCGRGASKSAAACGSPPEDMSTDIKIIPGEYKVMIYSFKYPKPDMVIPPDKRIIKLPYGRKEYWIPEEDIVFDEILF